MLFRSVVWVNTPDFWAIRALARRDEGRKHIYASAQVPVGRYRADFLLGAYYSPMYPKLVCVECDGYEFHGTPEAIARDAERDRALNLMGVETIRFRGATIHRDQWRCAHRAIEAVSGEDRNPPYESAQSRMVAAERLARQMHNDDAGDRE